MSINKIKKTISQTHAVILQVPHGFGYDFINDIVDSQNYEVIFVEPYIHAQQKTKIINVEDISEIQSKIRGATKKTQVMIFKDANLITEEAQNKFLKTLEEPRDNLKFILCVENKRQLLPTIVSRAQVVSVDKLSNAESLNLLNSYNLDQHKKQQILFLANGLYGELLKLATDNKYFEKISTNVELAKRWLSGDTFEKITIISDIKADKDKSIDLLNQVLHIARATLSAKNATKNSIIIKHTISTIKKINSNGNVKLCLLELAIQ